MKSSTKNAPTLIITAKVFDVEMGKLNVDIQYDGAFNDKIILMIINSLIDTHLHTTGVRCTQKNHVKGDNYETFT